MGILGWLGFAAGVTVMALGPFAYGAAGASFGLAFVLIAKLNRIIESLNR